MIAVIFEVEPRAGMAARHLEFAAELRPALEACDGFVSIERFESLTRPGRCLSLSFWRDEDAVRAWRCHARHRGAQREGRADVFAGSRVRVVAVVRDHGLQQRDGAPADSRAALR